LLTGCSHPNWIEPEAFVFREHHSGGLTTEAIVAEAPEKHQPAAMGGGGMGGMDMM
jgi:hypothetical protein